MGVPEGSLGDPGGFFESSRDILEPLGDLLEASGSLLGASWGVRGSSGAVLKPSRSVLGASWKPLGAILAGPRGHETPSGVTSRGGEPMEGVPGGSWGALEASCTKTFGILKILQKPKENQ